MSKEKMCQIQYFLKKNIIIKDYTTFTNGIDEIFVENSNIGIASKDSSITKVNNAYLKNLETCISAYNKKQEFFGGFVEIKNIKCKNYLNKTNLDNKSKIIIKNELQNRRKIIN